MGSMDKVKVAVRVRPFNRREIDLGTVCVVHMDEAQTVLHHPSTVQKDSFRQEVIVARLWGEEKPGETQTFAFDHCFWSLEETNPKFASQEKVYEHLGNDILERSFEGYNACIFAYGQTGSGKSYTMMGTQEHKGIIPRLCDRLFEEIAVKENDSLNHKVEVSYMEIYNEKVRDLLDPKGKHNLRVREHNILGPYVDGLSRLAVSSFEDIDNLMCEGNKSRTVAATNMNSESSRSHAVFNIILTQTLTDTQSGVSGEKVSKISLVDLAGSERAQKTGAVGERLKEGSNINKSLTTLGLVISALADQGAGGKKKDKFIPYRDSVLTWLLKDNLGGNSKTVMVATLSPAGDNYEETLSTLRYADRAKRIMNHAVVNEDPNARIIRELREEVDMLKEMLDEAQSMKADSLRERLHESEKLMSEMSKTWEEKLEDTVRKHQERHAALEKMGISVQTSGIRVEQGKYYLVNLNADPSLNELLVYYLKDHTLIGRCDAPVEQDIQLSGLGIMPEHCIVDIQIAEVFITPLEGARTCVNGCTITERTRVKHGDRLLWGNNHFFRVNCPKSANSPSSETPDNIDYEYAQQELMNAQMGDDPVQEAISAIEKQHEEEKQEALEKQRMMYERQMQMLRNQLMSPSTPSMPYLPFFDPLSKLTSPGIGGAHMQSKYRQWAQERDNMFRQSLIRLKEEVVKANALVREANSLAQEMGKQTEFSVTLQIPANNLTPNRKRGTFVSEPAILVKRKCRANQVWDMEKFENKIVDMRDMYEERKEKGLPLLVENDISDNIYDSQCVDAGPPLKGDPFYESQENHNLIGVANVFLEALFHNVKLDYQVPVISQQGEVAGRLHVELSRVAGTLPDRMSDETSSDGSGDSRRNSFIDVEKDEGVTLGSSIVCRVCIKEARGLPPALSNFVFCQYSFWGCPDPIMVPPAIDPEHDSNNVSTDRVMYQHHKEFTVHITEEFMEHCTEGALSIEVWGNRTPGFTPNLTDWKIEDVQAKSRSIMDRWIELTRKLELWVEINELNEQGEYVAVEVAPKPEVFTGGVFQLRQGHSRRILVQVKTVQNSGTLPIICESISSLSIGCVCARSKLQKGLDSYQEIDLSSLRDKWTEALDKRRRYLDEQLQKIMSKEESDKTEAEAEREKSLLDQWVGLTEERNAVLVPQAGSGIPGAPADWDPPPNMEQHIPVIFLDLNADDMSTPNVKEGTQAAGVNAILPKEHGAKFYTLPFVKTSEKDVLAVVSWDSSIHDSPHLNRVTQANERVYLILKAVVRLSHPAAMEVVLRKRLSINVYKRQSITEKLKKRIGRVDNLCSCGLTYEIVSNIPKASEDLEDRESLAQMAASQNEQNASDGETYIEKYIRGLSAVESILTLDRLRQEVTIKELLASSGGHRMKKATSVPNMHNIVASPRGLDDMMRSDSSHDLTFRRDSDNFSPMQKPFSMDSLRLRGNGEMDPSGLPNKTNGPFGLWNKVKGYLSPMSGWAQDYANSFWGKYARPNFLNLRTNIYNCKPSPKAGISPQPAKLVKPLTTLVEEQCVRETKPLLKMDEDDSDEDEFAKLKVDQTLDVDPEPAIPPEGAQASHSDSVDSDEFQEFQEFHEDVKLEFSDGQEVNLPTNSMTHSSTGDSLVEVDVPVKGFTPSMASSGYGSQAVSTQTLSSEDSTSVRSIGTDDTSDLDARREQHKVAGSGVDKSSDEEGVEAASQAALDLLGDREINPEQDGRHLLQRSGSLIDADVPSNLGSPLQPTPTVELSCDLDAENHNGEMSADWQSQESVVAAATTQEYNEVGGTGGKSTDVEKSTEHVEKSMEDVEKSTEAVENLIEDVEMSMENVENSMEDVEKSTEDIEKSTEDVEKSMENVEKSMENVEKSMENVERSTEVVEPQIEVELTGANQEELEIVQISKSIDSLGSGELVQSADNESELESVGQGSIGHSAHVDSQPMSAEISGENESVLLNNNDVSEVYSGDESSQNNAANHKSESSEAENAAVNSTTKADKQSVDSNQTNASKSDVKLRQKKKSNGISEDDKTVRRRSWTDRTPDTIPENSTLSSQVKMRKSTSAFAVDTTKMQSLKPKTRSDKAKGGVSPMKATYRPVSMPIEMLALEEGDLSEKAEELEPRDSDNEDDEMSICSFGSRADLHRLGEAPIPSWIQVGEPAVVLFSHGGSKQGTVQFIGTTEFANGNWVGVGLDTPDGKNDGSVKGVRYFKCKSRHGLFVRHDKLIMDKKRRASKTNSKTSSIRRSTGNLSASNPPKETSSSLNSSFMKPTAASSAKHK